MRKQQEPGGARRKKGFYNININNTTNPTNRPTDQPTDKQTNMHETGLFCEVSGAALALLGFLQPTALQNERKTHTKTLFLVSAFGAASGERQASMQLRLAKLQKQQNALVSQRIFPTIHQQPELH
jgi:hypothetical protein